MIIFNLAPNDALSVTLGGKMSTVIMKADDIPAYDISAHKAQFVELVKGGHSGKMLDALFANIAKSLAPLRKDILHYTKTHLVSNEALEPRLTFWYYNVNKNEYCSIQYTIPSANGAPMRINSDFFKMIKGKQPKKRQFAELTVIDMMVKIYEIIHSEHLDLVSKEEWAKEIRAGGDRA